MRARPKVRLVLSQDYHQDITWAHNPVSETVQARPRGNTRPRRGGRGRRCQRRVVSQCRGSAAAGSRQAQPASDSASVSVSGAARSVTLDGFAARWLQGRSAVRSRRARPRGLCCATSAGGRASSGTSTGCGTGKAAGMSTRPTPNSGAYGIPQALPAWKMASAGRDWRTSARVQILWGLRYIRERFGSPQRAWDHEISVGWCIAR